MSKQIGISVDTHSGKILIEFDRKGTQLEMTAQQAANFAEAIVMKTMKLGQTDSGIILDPLLN